MGLQEGQQLLVLRAQLSCRLALVETVLTDLARDLLPAEDLDKLHKEATLRGHHLMGDLAKGALCGRGVQEVQHVSAWLHGTGGLQLRHREFEAAFLGVSVGQHESDRRILVLRELQGRVAREERVDGQNTVVRHP